MIRTAWPPAATVSVGSIGCVGAGAGARVGQAQGELVIMILLPIISFNARLPVEQLNQGTTGRGRGQRQKQRQR